LITIDKVPVDPERRLARHVFGAETITLRYQEDRKFAALAVAIAEASIPWCCFARSRPVSMPTNPDGIEGVLEPDEELVAHLTGVGASLLVTQRRVVIVRHRSAFRPRSGIRSWTYDNNFQVSTSPPRRGHAQFMLRTGSGARQAVSLFFAAEQVPDAQRLVGEIRKRVKAARAGV
jgi:hypothetical protein